MTGRILEIVIIAVIAAAVIWALIKTAKKAKRGGGCCGEHEAAEKSSGPADKDKANYPYSVDLKIGGMTCSNCARKVENALNALDGTWAVVDRNTGTAHVLLKKEPDIRLLAAAAARAGYTAEKKN